MPKAACCVVGCQVAGSVVLVSVSVSNDQTELNLNTSFNVNFASSTNQITADMKQKIRDILLEHGIALTVNDVVLFGGPV